ncbi:speckle-type POZ protein, partial [Mytilus galloprovincialis]
TKWHKYNGHCYYYSSERQSWFTAELIALEHLFLLLKLRKCREIGGYIIKIDDREENEKIYANRPKNDGYWIGLTDLNEGEFRWSFDQSKATFLPWVSGYGKKGNGYDCVAFNSGSKAEWFDYKCNTTYYYICERNFYRQWVSKVTGFKSQWDDDGWSAAQVKGPPNVYPQYGDIEGAWCPKGESSDNYITIEYSKKTYIQSINIYETYNGGSVWRISFKAPNGTWHTVLEVNRATLSTVTSSRIFSPPIQTVAFPTNEVHIEIDTTNTHEDYEMDAVEITGQC